jgi:hypothetical protein
LKKVLLDEGVPGALAGALRERGILVESFPNSWKGIENGKLLAQAERNGFAVLLSNDKNLFHQQNWDGRDIAVVVLPTNRLVLLIERAREIADTVMLADAATLIEIRSDGTRIRVDLHDDSKAETFLANVAPFRT